MYEGKLIHEDCYPQRSVKYEEVAIDGIKQITMMLGIKLFMRLKSRIRPKAHEWQLKYYMYVFEQHGINGAKYTNIQSF